MQVQWVFLVVSAFLASAVEMVEALTIVLATGVTRGWRSALLGVGAALVALAVLVAILGPAIATLVPLWALRIVVGTLLLIFGLQWLRKAIMRASGLKALHDEAAIYEREIASLRAEAPVAATGVDWPGFVVSFKGVFLEGLEVAFIVITFGSSAGSIPLAALGAALAIVLVTLAGVAAHQPLSRVPENTLKFAVGLLLTSFGTFWAAEGIGVEWPGGSRADLMLLAVLAFYAALAWALVAALRAQQARATLRPAGGVTAGGTGEGK
ncbi:MAG TPA: hypothetical protein VFW96_07600 [Thermomicrobiales bacterium]|nr:hypothetical protein [Thermomicrobiales bacterium]